MRLPSISRKKSQYLARWRSTPRTDTPFAILASLPALRPPWPASSCAAKQFPDTRACLLRACRGSDHTKFVDCDHLWKMSASITVLCGRPPALHGCWARTGSCAPWNRKFLQSDDCVTRRLPSAGGRYGFSRYRSPFVMLTVGECLFVIPLREQELSFRGRLNMQVVTSLSVPCIVVPLRTI